MESTEGKEQAAPLPGPDTVGASSLCEPTFALPENTAASIHEEGSVPQGRVALFVAKAKKKRAVRKSKIGRSMM